MTGAECQTWTTSRNAQNERGGGCPRHSPPHPDTSPLPPPATHRYPPPMNDPISQPTTPQCAPIGSLPAPIASVAGPGATRNRGGCFSRAQILRSKRVVCGDEYDSYDYDAEINLAQLLRGPKQPNRSPLPCRVAGDGSLRPTAPYARSTSVAPSAVRPSLGDQRLTMADDCSHSRTAARSAPVPLPAPVASLRGPSASRSRGGCFSRAQILGSKRVVCGTNTPATITMQKST